MNTALIYHKIVDIYSYLSEKIHKQAIDIGGGSYIVTISKGLPKLYSCFIRAIAESMYGESVKIQESVNED